jgi:hypothetical protein
MSRKVMSICVYYKIPYSGVDVVNATISRLQEYYELESTCLTVGESGDDLGVDANLSIVYDMRKLTNNEYGNDIAR